LNASGVLISGLRAPALTATPALERMKSTRLPATTLPALTRSSTDSGVVMMRSAGAPSLTLTGSTEPDRKLAFTLCPLSCSNIGVTASMNSVMAVEPMTAISAARAGVVIAAALSRPAATMLATVMLIFIDFGMVPAYLTLRYFRKPCVPTSAA
jgi:hypothetical protein